MGAKCSSPRNMMDKAKGLMNKKNTEKAPGIPDLQATAEKAAGDAKNESKPLLDNLTNLDLTKLDTASLQKTLGGVTSASGLKDQLKELGMDESKIEHSVDQAARYIKPEEGANVEDVQKQISEDKTVQDFVAKVEQAATRGTDQATEPKDASPDMVKKFMDSLKGLLGGKKPEDAAKDAAQNATSNDAAADLVAKVGENVDYNALVGKYFTPDNISKLASNVDVGKLVESQGGTSGIMDKLTSEEDPEKESEQNESLTELAQEVGGLMGGSAPKQPIAAQ